MRPQILGGSAPSVWRIAGSVFDALVGSSQLGGRAVGAISTSSASCTGKSVAVQFSEPRCPHELPLRVSTVNL